MTSIFRFSSRKIPRAAKWVAGAAVATPVFAIIQGAVLLLDYREHHLDAPAPISPVRGVVVMKSESPNQDFSKKPIRLLVLGDSLAVGVGVSKNGTPILPESIARILSQSFGGRPVSWTCVGTTGASSSRIVLDIKSYDDENAPNVLETKLMEWQATKRRAQEWVKQRQLELHLESVKEKEGAARNKLQKWWLRVKRDVKDFQKHVLHDDEEKQVEVSRLLRERRVLQRRMTLQDVGIDAREFDIAVVLTGLNDLKDVFLPFLMKGEGTSTKKPTSEDGLKGEFLRILDALKDRMNLDLPKSAENDESNDAGIDVSTVSKRKKRQGPLVVFPALPASPIPIFHRAPLSWFVLPIISMMDHNKKVLAEKFPNMVLFVEQPSTEVLRQIEDGRGPLIADRKTEQVLLNISDATQRAKEQVERLMRQHYERWTNAREEDEREREQEKDEPRDAFENACHDHLDSSHDSEHVGSTLISADNIHPNDDGYDFWGRHIAAAIVEKMAKNEQIVS